MECTCGGVIKITHTYKAGKVGKTSSGRCRSCNKRYTFATFLVGEADGYGNGAASLATKLVKGDRRISIGR